MILKRALFYCRLSQIIVDTDKTASEILSHMNKNKMRGDVSFLPLNRLQVTLPQFPQHSSVSGSEHFSLRLEWAQENL